MPACTSHLNLGLSRVVFNIPFRQDPLMCLRGTLCNPIRPGVVAYFKGRKHRNNMWYRCMMRGVQAARGGGPACGGESGRMEDVLTCGCELHIELVRHSAVLHAAFVWHRRVHNTDLADSAYPRMCPFVGLAPPTPVLIILRALAVAVPLCGIRVVSKPNTRAPRTLIAVSYTHMSLPTIYLMNNH